jgi:hypothetical protein
VTCLTKPRDEAVDWQVVGRVAERHVGALPVQERGKPRGVESVSTGDAVITADPHVAYRGDRVLRARWDVWMLENIRLRNIDLQKGVNLDDLEAGELQVEAQGDQLRKLRAKPLVVPCAVLRDPVQRQAKGLHLRL